MAIKKFASYVLVVIVIFLSITPTKKVAAQDRIDFVKGELISAPKDGMYDIPYLNGNKQEYVFLGQKIPQASKYIEKGEPKAEIIDGKVSTNCFNAAIRVRISDPETGVSNTIITDTPCSFVPECEIIVLEFLNLDISEVREAVKAEHQRCGIR